MKLTESVKKEIDDMSLEEMLERWRFDVCGTPIFEGESGNYFAEVMKQKRNDAPTKDWWEISKKIGW